MRGVFLDISKAFDKVWYDRIILKLNSCGAEGEKTQTLRTENKELSQMVKHLSGQK